MTLADMILAHAIIDQIGIDVAVAILEAADGDAPLDPKLHGVADRAATLLEHELGEHETATQEVRAAVRYRLQGIYA